MTFVKGCMLASHTVAATKLCPKNNNPIGFVFGSRNPTGLAHRFSGVGLEMVGGS